MRFSSFRVTCPITSSSTSVPLIQLTSNYPVPNHSKFSSSQQMFRIIAVICIKLSKANMRDPYVHPPRDSSPSRHWQRCPLSPKVQLQYSLVESVIALRCMCSKATPIRPPCRTGKLRSMNERENVWFRHATCRSVSNRECTVKCSEQ